MKLKRIGNIKNITLTLLALLSTAILCAEAVATDDLSTKQDNIAKETTSANPPVEINRNKDGTTADPASIAKHSKGLPYFAKVGKMFVTWIDYKYEYASEASKTFYHAKPSDDRVAVFQRQVGDTLVTNAMLVQEAMRRKLKPDEAYVKQNLDQIEHRFANDPKWPEARVRVLPILTARVQYESLRNKLETQVRNVPPPSTKQLKKYYAEHLDKFTAPSQPRVAIILLRVDPGAPDSDWQKASEEGQDLVKRIRAGEDFAKLARQYSGDKTAEDGGDMGYLHEGMLPGLPAETVNKLQPGETSDPVNLMEGVGIFRLIDRKQPEVRTFKVVRERAKELWLKEQSDVAWNSLIEKLKKNTPVQVDESHFLPLPVVAEKPASGEEATKP